MTVGGPDYLRLLRAPNPGPMTLDGTNTWLVGVPGGSVVVVDPGPAVEAHREAVEATAGGRIAAVVLTHRHLDHAEAAAGLAGRAGCPVHAVDPAFRVGDGDLAEGTRIPAGDALLTAYATPGHTSDSCSLLLRGPDGVARLLTGDTVLGRGTSVITHPDGDVGAYLASLDRLQRLVAEEEVVELLPGHGPVVTEPGPWLAFYRRHREERLDQVRAALAEGARTATEVVERVYADVDPAVRAAAEQSVRAQLDHLARRSGGS